MACEIKLGRKVFARGEVSATYQSSTSKRRSIKLAISKRQELPDPKRLFKLLRIRNRRQIIERKLEVRVHLRDRIDPRYIPRIEHAEARRALQRRDARHKGAHQAVDVDGGGVVVDCSQDSGVGHVWVLGDGEVCDEGAEGEAHNCELVWRAEGAGVLSGFDGFCELDEDGLLLAKLVGEA